MLLSALVACGGDATDPATEPACDDPSLTWDNAGQPFVTAWCTTCHAPGLQGPARFGAPVEVDLDTLDAVWTYAERIRVRALSDDATMPPAGPAIAEDRDRFEAWLDCGAPGTTTPAVPACSGETSPGDWTASTDGPPCPDVDHIGGELIVDVDATAGWECLCEVDGALQITGGAEVALPELTRVAAVRAVGVVELERVALPIVRSLSALELRDLPALTALELHRLEEVEQDVLVTAAPALSFLQPLDSLADVGGSVVLEGLGITDDPLLRRLAHVGGDLRLADHDVWTTLAGFDALVAVDGDLQIQDNPALSTLPGMPGPVQVGGDLVWLGNPEVMPDEALALQDRLVVQGEILD